MARVRARRAGLFSDERYAVQHLSQCRRQWIRSHGQQDD
jgi:hypothetical protein